MGSAFGNNENSVKIGVPTPPPEMLKPSKERMRFQWFCSADLLAHNEKGKTKKKKIPR